MIRNMVHPLNAMFSSPGVYKAVLEMSPVVRLSPLRGTMSPQDLLLKAQDGVPGSSMGHSLIYLLVVSVLLISPTLGDMGIYMTDFDR
ncbi:hypothetical protein DUI87_01773 [Hirundo rustica rustica]|uniref:Uncharacterized protein n=1 Tax=Hirundo rustica rustica TaxID=333673 RepID=A0A3M0LCX8_HIRRU|nr:hypothetical protein DUI87_01773 [Hirundo rustica rustica]